MEHENKILSFTDLRVWKEAHKLVLAVYQITKIYPKDELFGLTSQMRRAAVSITSNLAEGFTRQTVKEKIQFYYTSIGSLCELKNQTIISKDLVYLSEGSYNEVCSQITVVHKLLNAFIRSVKANSIHVPKYQIPNTKY